jgi:hypothetical protein
VIEGFDPAMGVNHDDAVDGGVDNRAPSRFARAQRALQVRALRQILQ